MIDYLRYLYGRFGVEPRAELSTRPEKQARQRRAVGPRRGARSSRRSTATAIEYVVSPGEGSFYGPKIDLHMTDVLGRSWQMGTIQLDVPDARAVRAHVHGADNREHSPVVIHRALLGSLERFIGILIEHYGGAFPFWLAPVQARISRSARRTGRRRAQLRGAARRARASAPRSTSVTRRSASGSATPSSRRCRSSSCTATASRTRRALARLHGAGRAGAGRRAVDDVARRAARALRELAAEADPR